MKISFKLTLLSLAVSGLAACASSQEQASYVQPAKVGAPGQVITDEAYVSTVEQVARRRGVGVHWVNVPTKRVAKE